MAKDRTKKILIFLTVIFACLSLSLLIYVIHSKVASEEADYVARYHGLFKTREEQVLIAKEIHDEYMAQNISFCFDGNDIIPWRSLTTAYLLNGCCKSSLTYYAPDTATTMIGRKKVTLVQMNSKKQYLNRYDCSPYKQCTDCTCVNEPAGQGALVRYANGNVNYALVVTKGCCKCVNNDIDPAVQTGRKCFF